MEQMAMQKEAREELRRRKQNRRRFSPGDWFFAAVLLLVIIGSVNVYSSTFYMNLRTDGEIAFHLKRHLAYVGMGAFFGWCTYKLNYRNLRKQLWFWGLVTIALLIVVAVAGLTVNGARRWIAIAGFTFQPSEMAKIVGIMWASSYLAKLRDRERPVRLWASLFKKIPFFGSKKKQGEYSIIEDWKPLLFPLLCGVMVFRQPDLGTVIIILGVPVFLYIIAGQPLREIFGTFVVSVIAFAAAVVVAPYRMERLRAWYDPFSYARDIGYQATQSIIAIGSGGLFGQGAGRGHSKFAYLPEQFTDFAYAVFAQEWGFFASLLIPLLFVVMLWCGWRIASETKDRYGKYLVYGLTFLFTGQAFYNIAMCAGLLPVTGVPLPFISYGGSAMVMNLIAVGMVLGVERKTIEMKKAEEKYAQVRAVSEGRPRRWRPPQKNRS